MRVAIFSDLHVHAWAEHAKPHSRCSNDRLWDCVSVIHDVYAYCRHHDITTVLFGGDLFHKRGVIYTEAWNLVQEAFKLTANSNITTYLNDGNHDHANKAGSVHALEGLRSKNVRIVPAGLAKWVINDELILTSFPYTDSHVTFKERLEKALDTPEPAGLHRIGLFHHGFRGARVGSTLEYQVKEEIDASILKGAFDTVFSGHYHTRQDIVGCLNASYIGSPLQHTRTDMRKAGSTGKGFLVYDTDKLTTTFVPLGRPEFILLTQKEVDSGDADVEGHFVDVVFEDYPGGKEELEKDLLEAGARGLNVEQARKVKVTSSKPRMVVDSTLDTKTVLTQYVKHEPSDIDDAELIKVGLDLIGRVHK